MSIVVKHSIVTFFRVVSTISFCLAVGLGLFGCGGGTSGTGDTVVTRFKGTVKAPGGAPVQNVDVAVAETGDTGVTNGAGEFSIETNLSSGDATLLFTGKGINGQTKVTGIPTDGAVVTVNVEVDSTNNMLAILSINIEPTNSGSDGKSVDSAVGQQTNSGSPQDNTGDAVGGRPGIEAITTTWRGKIVSDGGGGLRGVRIGIPAVDKWDTTDSKGKFSFQTQSTGKGVVIVVSYHGMDGQVRISRTPKDSAIINLILRISDRISSGVPSNSRPGGPDLHDSLDISVESVKVQGR